MEATPAITPGSNGLSGSSEPLDLVTASGPITRVPVEILMHVLKCLPDIITLRETVLKNKLFHDVFTTHKRTLIVHILKNELPERTLTHALVCHKIFKNRDTLPEFQNLDIDTISCFVNKIRGYRDNLSAINVSAAEALAISRQGSKVKQICNALIEEGAYAREQQFLPLWESIRCRLPDASEITRIQQAIYLFQILAYICKNLAFQNGGNAEQLADCQDKVIELQKCLVEQFMAPWELYQVIGVRSFFQRTIYGLGTLPHKSERLLPRILTLGLDQIHECICIAGPKKFEQLIIGWEIYAAHCPPHALGLVVSRGFNNRWSRKLPGPFEDYKPFDYDDYLGQLGYGSWVEIEKRQVRYLPGDPAGDILRPELERLEGQLDLWSAALWNPARWDDIDSSICDATSDAWVGTRLHWDTFTVGLQAMADTIMPE